jgi:hypothetical protein
VDEQDAMVYAVCSPQRRPFALPHPDALSPLPDRPCAVQPLVYVVTTLESGSYGQTSLASLAYRGGAMQTFTSLVGDGRAPAP